MTKNAYVHIPFCKESKCHYCSFVSCPDLSLKDNYLDSLKEQIKSEYGDENLNTIYFGGGTPSLLEIHEVSELLDLFNFENNAEISFEVNPESVDFEYLKALKGLGINRLSIGAQSFDDKILKTINRKHSSNQIVEAVKASQDASFDNISLDFIYGLPMQELDDFISDLKKAISLGIQHISLYGLKIEEGCHFFDNKPDKVANQDVQADMYLKAVETLKNNGFEHYEISNFSLPGLNSRHNLNYWDNNSYYGFGCSASGYVNGVRYQMLPDVAKYIESPLIRDFEQILEANEILEEEIFLGFRKIAGIDTEKINLKFGIEFDKKYAKTLEKYSQFLRQTTCGWALTTDGLLISNEILAEFID